MRVCVYVCECMNACSCECIYIYIYIDKCLYIYLYICRQRFLWAQRMKTKYFKIKRSVNVFLLECRLLLLLRVVHTSVSR